MMLSYSDILWHTLPAPTNQFRWSLEVSRELVLCDFMKRAINKAYAPDCDKEFSIYLLEIGPYIKGAIRRCLPDRNLSVYQTSEDIQQLASNLFESTERAFVRSQ